MRRNLEAATLLSIWGPLKGLLPVCWPLTSPIMPLHRLALFEPRCEFVTIRHVTREDGEIRGSRQSVREILLLVLLASANFRMRAHRSGPTLRGMEMLAHGQSRRRYDESDQLE